MLLDLQGAALSSFRPAVVEWLRYSGIRDHRVLAAVATVPRASFMTCHDPESAYLGPRLPPPHDQAVLSSYLVALMLEALQLEPCYRVLEIGTGAGYSTAVLAQIVREVYSIERSPEVAASARTRLAMLGYGGIMVRCDDGTLGWPACAPYDAILVTASIPTIPATLLEQLVDGGRIVMPLGEGDRPRLVCAVKTGDDVVSANLGHFRFAPLVESAGEDRHEAIAACSNYLSV